MQSTNDVKNNRLANVLQHFNVNPDSIKEHKQYLAIVTVLYLVIFLGFAILYKGYNPPFNNVSDLAVHFPRAYKLQDAELFSRDPAFMDYGLGKGLRADLILFPLMLSKLLPLLGGIRQTLMLLSLLMGCTFSIGTYFLTYCITGHKSAGILAAFFADLDYLALGTIMLGFLPHLVLTRNLIVAVSPFFLTFFLRYRNSNLIWILYGVLGLLVNFHVLAPIHLLLIITFTYLATTTLTWMNMRRIIIACGIASVGASPFLIAMTSQLSGIVTVTEEEAIREVFHYYSTLTPLLPNLMGFVIMVAPFLLLSFWELYKKRRTAAFTTYRFIFIITLALPWIGVFINQFTLSLRQFEPLRMTRYYFALSIPLTASCIDTFLQRQKNKIFNMLCATLLILTVSLISRPQFGYVTIHWLIDRGFFQEYAPKSTNDNGMEWQWPQAHELFMWVEVNTPKDALFLVPVDWGLFRVYGKRSIVVDNHNAWWSGWYDKYHEVVDLYDNLNPAEFIQYAALNDIDYVVLPSAVELPGISRVFVNHKYSIYKTN